MMQAKIKSFVQNYTHQTSPTQSHLHFDQPFVFSYNLIRQGYILHEEPCEKRVLGEEHVTRGPSKLVRCTGPLTPTSVHCTFEFSDTQIHVICFEQLAVLGQICHEPVTAENTRGGNTVGPFPVFSLSRTAFQRRCFRSPQLH